MIDEFVRIDYTKNIFSILSFFFPSSFALSSCKPESPLHFGRMKLSVFAQDLLHVLGNQVSLSLTVPLFL